MGVGGETALVFDPLERFVARDRNVLTVARFITPGSELLADEAQVVGRFEVGNPVVEETDAVRPTKAIQFVEPDRPLAQALSEVLEQELEPTCVYTSMMRAGSGPTFHIVWGIRRGFSRFEPHAVFHLFLGQSPLDPLPLGQIGKRAKVYATIKVK